MSMALVRNEASLLMSICANMDTSAALYDVWNLQGCVEPIHVSMEASVQRLESRYVSVHWASKGHVANTVSFLILSSFFFLDVHIQYNRKNDECNLVNQ